MTARRVHSRVPEEDPVKIACTFASMILAAGAGACSRDARPAQTTTPPPAEPIAVAPPPVTGDVPDLEVPMERLDEPGGVSPGLTAFLDPGAATRQPVREAIAILRPTQGSRVAGVVRLRESAEGIEVISAVDNLPGGAHAYHVHVYGDCSAPDATSAGPHFHFTGSSLDTEVDIITGDLGELRGGTSRTATHRARIPSASLQGTFSLIGRAVVVHAKGNDPRVTPDGGAGDRIACGVIGVANPQPPQTATREVAAP